VQKQKYNAIAKSPKTRSPNYPQKMRSPNQSRAKNK